MSLSGSGADGIFGIHFGRVNTEIDKKGLSPPRIKKKKLELLVEKIETFENVIDLW